MKYRGLVIGAGAIGALLEAEPDRPKPATHAGALAEGLNTELVGIVDSDVEVLASAQKLFPQVPQYSNAEEALTIVKPDLVAIATPAGSHVALIRSCIAHGVKMIVCEKPIAPSLADAKEIESLLSGTDVVFVLNYQRRFFRFFGEVRTRIQSGELGAVQHVTCYYSNGLYNNGGHTADALEFLLSEPIVTAMPSRWRVLIL